MNTIVTLIGFSDVTPRLIEETERFAKALRSQVIVVHVVSKDPMVLEKTDANQIPSEERRKELIAEDYKRLSSLAERLSSAGLNVQVEQLVDANIGKAMMECEHWKADLIIVGSHRHGALYNWFVGSVTNDVLKTAQCPVLVVPVTSEK